MSNGWTPKDTHTVRMVQLHTHTLHSKNIFSWQMSPLEYWAGVDFFKLFERETARGRETGSSICFGVKASSHSRHTTGLAHHPKDYCYQHTHTHMHRDLMHNLQHVQEKIFFINESLQPQRRSAFRRWNWFMSIRRCPELYPKSKLHIIHTYCAYTTVSSCWGARNLWTCDLSCKTGNDLIFAPTGKI